MGSWEFRRELYVHNKISRVSSGGHKAMPVCCLVNRTLQRVLILRLFARGAFDCRMNGEYWQLVVDNAKIRLVQYKFLAIPTTTLQVKTLE